MSQSTENNWIVMKFGGSSVARPENWQRIVDLVRERQADGLRPVIVHSAMADTSNRLEQLLDEAGRGEESRVGDEIKVLHREIASGMNLDADELLGDYFAELDQLASGIRLVREVSPRVQVKVLSLGELMATTLGAAYLRAAGVEVTWMDARDVLQSYDIPGASERSGFLAASCDSTEDPVLQEEFGEASGVVLTQGFIASNPRGEPVLLGRGGSDTSAAYFAARLRAERLEIWTDVPGMFSANPRQVSGARHLQALRYEEAQEIASTGGSVLHPRCITPVRRYGIPLWVGCTSRPDLPGTVISSEIPDDSPRVKAISSRNGITIVSMETLGMWHEVGFLSEAFRCFSDIGLSVDLISTSETNVTVTLDPGVNVLDGAILEKLRERLAEICDVRIIDNAGVVSLVGQKIRALLHEIGPALEVFEEHRIHLVSQAASDLNLSFVVEEEQTARLVKKLHTTLVNKTVGDKIFGDTWEELDREEAEPEAVLPSWWMSRSQELAAIGAEHGAAYVYDQATLDGQLSQLTGLTNVDEVFFAIKSNNHPDVLRRVEAAGVNFECVSPGEIRHVLELFPELDRKRILYTPNFAAREDYEFGVEQGVWVTLDNLHPLRHWPDAFAGQDLLLRVDTGTGRGHHEHVKTAGVHSKFGIPLFELREAEELTAAAGARVVGLHAHTGSGILNAGNWQDIAETLAEASEIFPDVRILDLGGGLGIPEKPGQEPLDMAAVDKSLALVREAWPHLSLWLEPGRFVVAQCGVLLAQVTQLKGKGDVKYVGIATGMNSLIRPALYGAYHEIANLSRVNEPATEIVSIVGPICETGDRLGTDRLLPVCQEGDVLAIANAGAYGAVMASDYNLRGRVPELMV